MHSIYLAYINKSTALSKIIVIMDILNNIKYFWLTWETGKRYLRVYIQIRFRHACHETRDRQSRSLVSGQEEGWGEVKVLLKFWIQLRSMSGLLKKTQNKICLLKSKFEVICEQFWRAVKRMSVRLFINKNSNNKFWTLFRKILKSD